MKPADEADSRSITKADLARELNQEISNIGRSLAGGTEASERLTFYCECGCLGQVRLTLAAFDASGEALLAGHSRPRGAS